MFDEDRSFPATLVFAAGPNAGASMSPQGSTARTLNARCSDPAAGDYALFKAGVTAALTASLDAMVDQGCTVALVGMLSTGIYAGQHRGRINEEFVGIVNGILNSKPAADLKPRGAYFQRVVIPILG